MKREIFVISLIFLLLIISAQQGCEQKATGKENPFVGGKDGILIDFVEGAPPPEVFDQEHEFEIVIRLQNKGEADVKKEDGKVEISGISEQDFKGEYSKSFPEDLFGAYKNPEGDAVEGAMAYLTFSGFEHQKKLPGNVLFTVRADACYKYETTAVTHLCVRRDTLAYGEVAVCEIDEEKTVYNSGSPIQITSFKQNIGGTDKLSFTFKIAHKGIGAIYSPEGELCETGELAKRNRVKVTVDTKMLGTKCGILEGDYHGHVNLYDGTASITCIQPIPGTEAAKAYEKPIEIRVEFDYKLHIDTPLLVKHIR